MTAAPRGCDFFWLVECVSSRAEAAPFGFAQSRLRRGINVERFSKESCNGHRQ